MARPPYSCPGPARAYGTEPIVNHFTTDPGDGQRQVKTARHVLAANAIRDRSMGRLTTALVIAGTAGIVAACSSSRYDNDYKSFGNSAQPQYMSAGDISNILRGKTFRWRGPNNSGSTIYAADGTSLIEVDGKGTTTGQWYAKDGQLCESFAEAPFLPGGVPMKCQSFSRSGNSYMVGPAVFTQTG